MVDTVIGMVVKVTREDRISKWTVDGPSWEKDNKKGVTIRS